MCFPLDVSYPCTPVHISTIEPCAVSVRAFVLFKSGRLCTYKTLGECKGGESRSSTIGQLQFASCANGSTKTKQKKKMRGDDRVKQVCAFFLNVVFTASAVNCQGLCCLY